MNYHRRSIRLKHYDYSREGYYFITICSQGREHLFGEILNGVMILNEAGRMVEKWHVKLEEKFPNIKNREMVIMPNHIHFIVEIVGADPCVRPNVHDKEICVRPNVDENNIINIPIEGRYPGIKGRHTGLPLRNDVYVGDVVQWFKTMTTNQYIKMVKNNTLPPFNKRIWQRNYHEHVVRDDVDYLRVAEYTINNPLTWKDDIFAKQYQNT